MIKLPEVIETQRKILCTAELPSAKCIHLGELFRLLSKDRTFSSIMQELDEAIEKMNQTGHEQTAKSVEWIRDKFDRLKKSKWKNHPIVAHKFRLAETIIFCKDVPNDVKKDNNKLSEYHHQAVQLMKSSTYPLYGFIGPALNALDSVALLIAEFGEKEIFNDWGELVEVENRTNLNYILPGVTASEAKKMSFSDFCKESGYGFINFQIENLEINGQDPIVYFQQYRLVRLILPSCIESCLSGFLKESLSRWVEARDTDNVQLYQFLKILSKYQEYKDFKCQIANSWEEHELQAVGLSLKEFFRTFSSLDPRQYPIAPGKINQLVDLFLNMALLALGVKKNKRGRPRKSGESAFIKQEIKVYLSSFGKKIDKKNLRTSDEMYSYICEQARQKNPKLLETLNPFSVIDIYKAALGQIGIRRKGGRPSKKKRKTNVS